ncbi:UNVERIFIED_CONTAM: katnb1 [Trichonephila clavipes]
MIEIHCPLFQSLSGHTSTIECVKFGQCEDIVCAGSSSGALKIWDLEAAKIIRTLLGHKGNVKCVDFHPYGDFVASGSSDSNIKVSKTKRCYSFLFNYCYFLTTRHFSFIKIFIK